MCQSVDCYDTDPGGQATYHDGHKITFNENELKLDCGILAIKKSSVKTLQIRLYSVFFKTAVSWKLHISWNALHAFSERI